MHWPGPKVPPLHQGSQVFRPKLPATAATTADCGPSSPGCWGISDGRPPRVQLRGMGTRALGSSVSSARTGCVPLAGPPNRSEPHLKRGQRGLHRGWEDQIRCKSARKRRHPVNSLGPHMPSLPPADTAQSAPFRLRAGPRPPPLQTLRPSQRAQAPPPSPRGVTWGRTETAN